MLFKSMLHALTPRHRSLQLSSGQASRRRRFPGIYYFSVTRFITFALHFAGLTPLPYDNNVTANAECDIAAGTLGPAVSLAAA